MYPLLFHFGHIAIPTYGVCTALALLAALAVSVHEAHRAGMHAHRVWNLGLIAILVTLFGARLLMIAAHGRVFRAHPFWLLGLTTLPGGWIALGGAALGLAAAVLYALAEGLPLLRMADVAAPGAALAFAVNRIGAFFGGLGWGTPTRLPWGVTYRSIVAYLWYRVPLGVKLQPIQLYDAAASLAIFALLLRSGRWREGEAAGAWLFLYGLCRFFLEFLRGDAVREQLFAGALTLTQTVSIGAVIAGGTLWLRRKTERKRAAMETS